MWQAGSITLLPSTLWAPCTPASASTYVCVHCPTCCARGVHYCSRAPPVDIPCRLLRWMLLGKESRDICLILLFTPGQWRWSICLSSLTRCSGRPSHCVVTPKAPGLLLSSRDCYRTALLPSFVLTVCITRRRRRLRLTVLTSMTHWRVMLASRPVACFSRSQHHAHVSRQEGVSSEAAPAV